MYIIHTTKQAMANYYCLQNTAYMLNDLHIGNTLYSYVYYHFLLKSLEHE